MAFSEGKTTIVLGAGSSREVGLPVGKELKSQISDLLDIRYEHGYNRISGSGAIDRAFRAITERQGARDINPFLEACWKIRDAMPQAISIDNYLDAHGEDYETLMAGKLGIVQSILHAERNSSLYLDPHSVPKMIDFQRHEDTWFNKFVQLLTENCRLEDLADSLCNVKIVSFNYDRCIEHFLYYAIQNYYRVSASDTAKVLKNLVVYHPYGRVGSLPWQNQDIAVEFGAEIRTDFLLSSSEKIRTFAEGTDSKSSNIDEIRYAVSNCDRLIFLGFAYHPMNMKLISSSAGSNVPRASYGTALGLSGSDCSIVENEIRALVGREIEKVQLRNDLTCSKLLDEYRRSLTSF